MNEGAVDSALYKAIEECGPNNEKGERAYPKWSISIDYWEVLSRLRLEEDVRAEARRNDEPTP